MLSTETVRGDAPAFAVGTLVRVRGEIDIASAQEFRDVLTDADSRGADPLIVSLEECRYCDSSGLAVLISMHRSIGPRLKIVVPRESPVRRILTITGLDQALNIVPSLSEAFAP